MSPCVAGRGMEEWPEWRPLGVGSGHQLELCDECERLVHGSYC